MQRGIEYPYRGTKCGTVYGSNGVRVPRAGVRLSKAVKCGSEARQMVKVTKLHEENVGAKDSKVKNVPYCDGVARLMTKS